VNAVRLGGAGLASAVRVLAAAGARRSTVCLAVAVGLAAIPGADAATTPSHPVSDEPGTIQAAFGERSYAPGSSAGLVVWNGPSRLTVQFFRAGPEGGKSVRPDVMTGVPVGPAHQARLRESKETIRLPVGRWPSGLYFARLDAPGGRLGFAPFVLQPERFGLHRVAVVLPTNTWQAYNFRDADHDGAGDTWYADPRITTVDLSRAYLNRGVPAHYEGYVRWLAHTGKQADYLSDDDLERVTSGGKLARLYDLIVFAGHEEYVTQHAYDIVERYRDLGGNLMFLSADNFNFRVTKDGSLMHGRTKWRALGRPEAGLVGVQYLDWNQGSFPNRPYVVTGAALEPWLFRGTGLHNGDRFGTAYGVEIDTTAAASPPGTQVLATIPDIFGPGRSAEMTYYETARGAKVFAAGAFNFDTPQSPATARMLENLWDRLSRP